MSFQRGVRTLLDKLPSDLSCGFVVVFFSGEIKEIAAYYWFILIKLYNTHCTVMIS